MAYHKFKASQIFTGTEVLGENHVLITDEEGIVLEIVDEKDAGDDVQHFKGILCPGFINCHCHLELSHLKNIIPEKTGLVDFVMRVLQKRESPAEQILNAIENAENEMLKNGIVAVGDICNTAHTLPQKMKGRLQYFNFIEISGFVPAFAEKRFRQGVDIYNQFIHHSPFTIHTTIVPHAAYSVSKELFQLINKFSAGKVSTIHNQESEEENKFFLNGESDFKRLFQQLNIGISFFQPSGKMSLETYLPWMKDASHLILVHNIFTTEEGIEFANQQSKAGNHEVQVENQKPQITNPKLFWCFCPNANLYIENTLPTIHLFRKHQCNIVLGTDSLASNYSLSILDEIKTIIKHYPHIPQTEILQWATLNGAKALQMDDTLGSLEKGKKPGVILIENLNEQGINANTSVTRLI